MAIVQELNESYFIERFREMGRGEQFTLDALSALYDYYDSLSDDMGEDIKLDVIAICCDWYESTATQVYAEYSDFVAALNDEGEESLEDDVLHEKAVEWLGEQTTVIDCGSTILYMAF